MLVQATARDLDGISEIEQLFFPNSMSPRQLELELAAGGIIIEKEGDGPVCGYAIYRQEDGLLDLLRLGVHPEHQGRKIGSRILQRLLETEEHAILTVGKANERALRLYLKFGFQITGHLSHEASWVMEWRRPSTS